MEKPNLVNKDWVTTQTGPSPHPLAIGSMFRPVCRLTFIFALPCLRLSPASFAAGAYLIRWMEVSFAASEHEFVLGLCCRS
jgi:hypothetical protein